MEAMFLSIKRVRLEQLHISRRLGSVEQTDVVKTKETSFENTISVRIFSIHPPCKVDHKLQEHTLQKLPVLSTIHLFLDLVDPVGGPGLNRRVGIGKVPLIRRDLALRRHVPLSGQEIQLLFGVIWVNHGERNSMERSVPRTVERILKVVRHRQNVFVVKMLPFLVSAIGSTNDRSNVRVGITSRPEVVNKVVELLIPQQATERLSLDITQFLRQWQRRNIPVELFCLYNSVIKNRIELLLIYFNFWALGEFVTNSHRLSRWDSSIFVKDKPCTCLGTLILWADRFLNLIDNVVVETVFSVLCFVLHTVEPFEVGFVIAEKQFGLHVGSIISHTRSRGENQPTATQFEMINLDRILGIWILFGQFWLLMSLAIAPRPRVTEVNLRHDMQRSRSLGSVQNGDSEI
ncbi:hypothetical protein OGAPHI_006787 [Ogataea philodendri]|uniref:Uncharacterized protein n=1 Tax=Ogataea philodendri TaxID=1378263 RepID=A0A9P8NX50_9ASCO|nr:uncharacterized protein OGAPHI_006787 [Ogataea philodendri]KAH3661380.1 hypothetical protein OGAPHI_006787 [Ogataea philodendri]